MTDGTPSPILHIFRIQFNRHQMYTIPRNQWSQILWAITIASINASWYITSHSTMSTPPPSWQISAVFSKWPISTSSLLDIYSWCPPIPGSEIISPSIDFYFHTQHTMKTPEACRVNMFLGTPYQLLWWSGTSYCGSPSLTYSATHQGSLLIGRTRVMIRTTD